MIAAAGWGACLISAAFGAAVLATILGYTILDRHR